MEMYPFVFLFLNLYIFENILASDNKNCFSKTTSGKEVETSLTPSHENRENVSRTRKPRNIYSDVVPNYSENCGIPYHKHGRRGRIVRGTKAEEGELPWQVSVRRWAIVAFMHFCGGTLVNKNFAITAAHCTSEVDPEHLLVVMGDVDIGGTEQVEREVHLILIHKTFDNVSFENDLSLLKFAEPVTFQWNIIPICLPNDDSDFIGKIGIISGWGRLYEDGPPARMLYKAKVPVMPNEICENMFARSKSRQNLPEYTFICAGYADARRDACNGDSGGPFVIFYKKKWRLAGVISWGLGCAKKNQPGVYTRVSEFKDWIKEAIDDTPEFKDLNKETIDYTPEFKDWNEEAIDGMPEFKDLNKEAIDYTPEYY